MTPSIVDSVLHAIGRTPLVRLRKLVPPGSADVLVKLEYYNPTGSYKDRMALAMIEGAEARGTLRPGMRVVELTGGHGGPHRVEGIAPGFVPPHLTAGVYDEARAIDEAEARLLARRLAKEEGVFAGTSSALNVVAALQLAKELGPGKVVATVAI